MGDTFGFAHYILFDHSWYPVVQYNQFINCRTSEFIEFFPQRGVVMGVD